MNAPTLAPGSSFASHLLRIETEKPRQFIDLTDDVQECIADAGITAGIAVVTSQHTTAAVVINEHEPELLKDLDRMLQEMAPTDRPYLHNDVPCAIGEQPNGHAHCQALLLGASVSLPVVAGKLALGRWQRIFLIELDCARSRRVTVTVLGG